MAGINFSFNWGNNNKPLSVEIDNVGNYFYEIFNSKNSQKKYSSYAKKLDLALTNIALLKVLALNADLFSRGLVLQGDDDKEILEGIQAKPNPLQNWTQYKWDFMFWLQIGTAIQYNEPVSKTTRFLNPAKINFSSSLLDKMKGLILRQVTFNDILKGTIGYKNGDGTETQIPIKDLRFYHDLSSGMNDNFMIGASRIDALEKVLCNLESGLDAKAINLEFSQKFIMSGYKASGNVGIESVGMHDIEKKQAEQSVRSNKKVHITKTPVDLKRFVDDIYKLRLDDGIKNDFQLVGNVYNMPKEIIDILSEGSTYENQEKATARHIEYFHAPKGVDFVSGLAEFFGLKDLKYSFAHLSFNQVFERERQEKIKLKLENEKLARELNVNIADYEY